MPENFTSCWVFTNYCML